MDFSGLFTALITPFSTDGSVDMESFEKCVEFQIENGVDGIVVLGTTGESPTISPEEHDALVEACVKIVDGRIKVIAGTGSNCTQEALDRSIYAQKVGVDALLQVSPYYNKPTQKGLYEHFKMVADKVDIPIILYNIKGRCGVNLETETLLRLSAHPNIVSVKEASGDLNQIKEVIARVPSDFTVLSGDDGIALELCRMGGDGLVSVLSNLLPKEMKQLITACENKNWMEAQVLHDQMADLFSDCFIETNPQPIKTLMAIEGFCEEMFRLPMVTMEEANRKKLLSTWENFSRLK